MCQYCTVYHTTEGVNTFRNCQNVFNFNPPDSNFRKNVLIKCQTLVQNQTKTLNILHRFYITTPSSTISSILSVIFLTKRIDPVYLIWIRLPPSADYILIEFTYKSIAIFRCTLFIKLRVIRIEETAPVVKYSIQNISHVNTKQHGTQNATLLYTTTSITNA